MIQISGVGQTSMLAFDVPAQSIAQLPLPDGDFGLVSIDGFADENNVRWLLFGSEIDRVSSEAQTITGSDPGTVPKIGNDRR
jgi:hypothetical protein